jgi:hypothetical protein
MSEGEAGTAARKLAGLRNKTGVKPLAPFYDA